MHELKAKPLFRRAREVGAELFSADLDQIWLAPDLGLRTYHVIDIQHLHRSRLYSISSEVVYILLPEYIILSPGSQDVYVPHSVPRLYRLPHLARLA
jgi:hypothetical protein